MQFTSATNDLLKAIQAAGRVVPTRPGLPITACVLLTAEAGLIGPGTVRVVGTDLERTIVVTLAANVTETGSLAIPAKLLGDFVGSLAGREVEVKRSPRGRAVTVTSGRDSARIEAMDADDFPPVPESAELTLSLPTDLLRQAISQVECAAAEDSTRPVLTGVLCQLDADGLTLAAADGFRLAVRTLSLDALVGNVDSPANLIVPAGALRDLAKLAEGETVGLVWDKASVTFTSGRLLLRSSLIAGQFPDYNRLIPTNRTARFVVNRSAWLQGTKVVTAFVDRHTDAIKLVAGLGVLTVLSESAEQGNGRADLDAEVDAACRVALGARYLREALAVLPGEQIELSVNGEQGALALRPVGDESYVHVVMPMHVPWPVEVVTEQAEVPA